MKFLLATTNKAKIKYYGERLKESGIDIVTLNDLNINLDVEESGKNPLENALIKAKAYNKVTNMPTIALDDGLYLDNVPNQPGTNVRRIDGKRLNDEEMIDYYISLVNKYGNNGILSGYFLKGVAIIYDDKIYTFEYKVNRKFSNKKSKIINEGYPLASIEISYGKFRSEFTKEDEEKIKDIEQNDIFDYMLSIITKLNNEKEIKRLQK